MSWHHLSLLPLAQAEERKDGQDHDDQTDEIDQPMHVPLLRLFPACRPQNCRKAGKFLSSPLHTSRPAFVRRVRALVQEKYGTAARPLSFC